MGRDLKVQSACRDCQMCTGHAFTGAGRSIGRASADVLTLGMTNLARKKCRLCAHPMSEHEGAMLNLRVSAAGRHATSVYGGQVLDSSPPPSQESPPHWYPMPDGRFRWWNGECWTDYVVGNPDDERERASAIAALAGNPPRWVSESGSRWRWWSGMQWTDDYSRDGVRKAPAEPTPGSAGSGERGASAWTAAQEIERLVALLEGGHISPEEFRAAKARLLGLG